MENIVSSNGNVDNAGRVWTHRMARAAAWTGAVVCHLAAVWLLFIFDTEEMDLVEGIVADVSRLLGGVALMVVGLWVELQLLPSDFLEE